MSQPLAKEEFVSKFPSLSEALLKELREENEMPESAVAWVKALQEHTVPDGKMNRGLTVEHSLRVLRPDLAEKPEYREKAIILGWCIEWLQACFLVADDIMDESLTRRGKPCWYKSKCPLEEASEEDKVGVIAVNDSLIIESGVYRLLKTHFRGEDFYLDLIELFHEITYKTELGQLLDLTSLPPKKVDISKFTQERYDKIVKYKTAFYSFYLPVALAMILSGKFTEECKEEALSILLPMGHFFQVQDDYLDCYGSPEVIGKVGRDIEENKCGWLIIQAQRVCNSEQFQKLQENYGQDDPVKVAAVKQVFLELNIEAIFKEYEEKCYSELTSKIKEAKHLNQDVYNKLLAKIFKRQK